MTTMLAARYLGPDRLEPVEVEVPSPGAGEALVEVEACGFCGSDIGIVSGVHPRARPPLTIGHEFCGRVVETGEGAAGVRPGDRVTLYPLISCGECYVCRHGQPHVCRTLRLYGFDADGGMARYVKVPAESLLPIPDALTPRLGALIEPLAVAVHAVSRVPLEDWETAVVLGAGPIGLLTAMVLGRRGTPQLFVTEINESRREFARRFGLQVLDAGDEGLAGTIRAATAGEGADVVMECAGAPAAALQMTSLVRCRGVLMNVGVIKKPAPVDLLAVNFKELTIVGSRVYTREDFRRAIEIAPDLPLDGLVTGVYPLAGVREAYDTFRGGSGSCKVLVEPGADAP